MPQDGLRTPRLGGQHLQRRQCRPDRRRGQAGVEDERPRRVDQVIAHRFRTQHHTALAAQRLGQRRGHHHIGRPGQADLGQQAASARTPHPQAVGLVDQQHRPVLPADLMQPAQRGQHAVGTEHRVGDHHGAFLPAGGERLRDGVGVPVRGHHDTRPRQPAGVDQRGVARRIRDHQRSRPGEPRHRGQVGGVARREHQSRVGPDEAGQRALELLMQFGVPGHQSRPGRARPPGAQRPHPGLDHRRVRGQSQVIVGGQVHDVASAAGSRPQRTAQPRLQPLPPGNLQPRQRRNVGAGVSRVHRSPP